jgi:hypothetical protein
MHMPTGLLAATLHPSALARKSTADELPADLIAVTIDGAVTARDVTRHRAAHARVEGASADARDRARQSATSTGSSFEYALSTCATSYEVTAK